MKKGIIILGLSTILLAGCATEETLSCTKSIKDDVKQTITMNVMFKDKKIQSMETKSTIDFKKLDEDAFNTIYKSMKKTYTSVDEDGVEGKISNDKQLVTATMDVDFNKMAEEETKKMAETYSRDKISEVTKEDVKKQMEKDDFTCK